MTYFGVWPNESKGEEWKVPNLDPSFDNCVCSDDLSWSDSFSISSVEIETISSLGQHRVFTTTGLDTVSFPLRLSW